jgi:Histidine kinase-like ATPase domain
VSGAYPVLDLGSFRSAGSSGPAGSMRSRQPWARTFPGVAASVPEARGFVAGLLTGCPARDVLIACASELCANAIAHTASGNGGAFIVEVACPRDGLARIAVTDDGGAVSAPAAGVPDPMADGGRGLALVAACTSRWGWVEAEPGRTVWAEACWPVALPGTEADQAGTCSRRSRHWLTPRGRCGPGDDAA